MFFVFQTATLTVGEDCDTGIVVKYGQRLDPTYTCAAKATSILEYR